MIRAHPKLFAGFSNPTILNNSILAAAGLASLHGVTGFQFFQPEIEPGTERAFWAMVSGPVAGTEVGGRGWRVYPRGCRSASVSGPVVGGNLWSWYPLVGTRWLPPTSGAILVLESSGGTYEMVDLALTQMRLAGVLDDIAALVIGAPGRLGSPGCARPGRGRADPAGGGRDLPRHHQRAVRASAPASSVPGRRPGRAQPDRRRAASCGIKRTSSSAEAARPGARYLEVCAAGRWRRLRVGTLGRNVGNHRKARTS